MKKLMIISMIVVLLAVISGCNGNDEQKIIKFSLNDTIKENASIKSGVNAKIFRNKDNLIYGFEVNGTTNYAEDGYDIIAAGISMIVINTINSLDTLSTDELDYDAGQGYSKCIVQNLKNGKGTKESRVLLESLEIGLDSIEDSYGSEYLKVIEIKD